MTSFVIAIFVHLTRQLNDLQWSELFNVYHKTFNNKIDITLKSKIHCCSTREKYKKGGWRISDIKDITDASSHVATSYTF